jgi:amidophosphoribosyltransferase
MRYGERGMGTVEMMSSAVEPIIPYAEVDDHPQEECGVFAIYRPGIHGDPSSVGPNMLTDAYGLALGLQHRGRSGAGVAYVEDGMQDLFPDEDVPRPYFVVHKDAGLVPNALRDIRTDTPERAAGVARLEQAVRTPVLVGHTRYSTSGGNEQEWMQPFHGRQANIAVAHNGNANGMRAVAEAWGVSVSPEATDSSILTTILDWRVSVLDGDVVAALQEFCLYIPGSYCLTITDGERIYAVRDMWGTNPLVVGKEVNDRGYVVASEDAALAGIEMESVRDVEPGEIVMIDREGEHSYRLDPDNELGIEPRPCMYNYIYLADPNSIIDSVSVRRARYNMGVELAQQYLAQFEGEDVADLQELVVVGVPNSGLLAAQGFADTIGVPFVDDIMAINEGFDNTRAFLLQGEAREAVQQGKHYIKRPELIEGKLAIVVDDSIIKGNTFRVNGGKVLAAGATDIIAASAAPTYNEACPMGMDTHNVEELVARGRTHEEIARKLEVARVIYNDTDAIQRAVEAARFPRARLSRLGRMCTTCVDGENLVRQARPISVSLGMPAMRGAFA